MVCDGGRFEEAKGGKNEPRTVKKQPSRNEGGGRGEGEVGRKGGKSKKSRATDELR